MELDLHARARYPRARKSFEQPEASFNPLPLMGRRRATHALSHDGQTGCHRVDDNW
jgi:hypothetical protein